MAGICELDWVTHCKWMHRWFALVFSLFGIIIFCGQWNGWIWEYIFFNAESYETSDYNDLVKFLTNAAVIVFLQYGFTSYFFYYIEDRNVHKKMLIINNFLWIFWLIWDFYFMSKLTVVGTILNLSARIPTFIWIVFVDIKMLQQKEENDQ